MKPEEVFVRNIAVTCWKCNRLKGGELPEQVKAKINDLLELKREQRIETVTRWVQNFREDYQVEFEAFRELVEMTLCSAKSD